MDPETIETIRYLLTHSDDKNSKDSTVREHYREHYDSLNIDMKNGIDWCYRHESEIPEDIEEAIDLVMQYPLSVDIDDIDTNAPMAFKRDESSEIEWSREGIRIFFHSNMHGKDITNPVTVIDGCIKPIAEYRLDDDVFFEFELEGEIIKLKIDEAMKLLRQRGMVFNGKYATDALSIVSRNMTRNRKIEGHTTYGIYSDDDGRLKVCKNPNPILDDQISAWKQMECCARYKLTKEDIERYIRLLGFWHKYESYPSFGLTFAAPFTPILRRNDVLVPHIIHYSQKVSIGKSTTLLACSKYMWGMDSISGDGLNSEFRFLSKVDSAAILICVEEAEKIDEKLSAIIKESAERWNAGDRGQKNLGMKKFYSKGVLGMSCNELSSIFNREGVIKRCLIVHYDSDPILIEKRMERSQELESLMSSLNPIGYQITDWAVAKFGTKENVLEEIREIRKKILDLNVRWKEPKRTEIWAIVYFGLKIFEHACQKMDVDWNAPSIREFYDEVINIVEIKTWETQIKPIEKFEAWFAEYLVRCTHHNNYTGETNIEGENILFKEDTLSINGESVRGYWVMQAILEKYNREMKERISTINELAIASCDYNRLSRDICMERNGKTYKAKQIRYRKERNRSAFIILGDMADDKSPDVTLSHL
jgi:hypothetical protein